MELDIKKICECIGKLYLESQLKIDELSNRIISLSKERDDTVRLLNEIKENESLR